MAWLSNGGEEKRERRRRDDIIIELTRTRVFSPPPSPSFLPSPAQARRPRINPQPRGQHRRRRQRHRGHAAPGNNRALPPLPLSRPLRTPHELFKLAPSSQAQRVASLSLHSEMSSCVLAPTGRPSRRASSERRTHVSRLCKTTCLSAGVLSLALPPPPLSISR